MIETSFDFHLKIKFHKLLHEAFKESFDKLTNFDLESDPIYITQKATKGVKDDKNEDELDSTSKFVILLYTIQSLCIFSHIFCS